MADLLYNDLRTLLEAKLRRIQDAKPILLAALGGLVTQLRNDLDMPDHLCTVIAAEGKDRLEPSGLFLPFRLKFAFALPSGPEYSTFVVGSATSLINGIQFDLKDTQLFVEKTAGSDGYRAVSDTVIRLLNAEIKAFTDE